MIEPIKLEDMDLSTEDCITILENIKNRARFHDETFPFMDKEYCERLAGLERLALEKAISALRNQA